MHILEAALAAQIRTRPDLAPLAAGRADSWPFMRLGGAFATVALLVLILNGAATASADRHPESDLPGQVR